MQQNFKVTEKMTSNIVKIVVIGVGGGGSNMLDALVESDIAKSVKIVAINTDAQALENSKAPHKIQIGKNITAGKGAGMKPEIGKASALESYDAIKEALRTF